MYLGGGALESAIGAFYVGGLWSHGSVNAGGTSGFYGFYFDSSRENQIYSGPSVQAPSVQMLACIRT